MDILLFGKNGQVGWELQRALAPLGRVIALDSRSTHYCGDFTDPKGIAETVRLIKPQVIVNAAAYTAVDKAESEPDKARLINAITVTDIAKAAEEVGAWFVHYSTDYVFNGQGNNPWCEEDLTGPLNIYGETKLEGELGIKQYCSKHMIFRTSWVYGSRGNNFSRTMLKLAKTHESLSVISDQFGVPTGADLIADCTAHAIKTALHDVKVAGVYHLTASGETTWHAYASTVIERARELGAEIKAREIKAVQTSAFPTPAKRPGNSRLNNEKFQRTFGLTLPQWQPGIERLLTEIL
ncbi:dTDP-4-dehydrorhamnose reductase [Pantoea allii]|uniref:dTDP-4-dehydrorhamnose reductase n=1 Tax=Pantoea allii TaxID=574096 RepID=UPI0039776533